MSEGYENVDPSHPLGGPDGGKDALCEKEGKKWIAAYYFPRGQKPFATIRKKFLVDLRGVAANKADALAFVTNQELDLGERSALKKSAGSVPVELYHLERVAMILDKPEMAPVRRLFLAIDAEASERLVQLQLAETEARLAIYPKIVPTGFVWAGGGGRLTFEVQNETASLFQVVGAECRWRLDHDRLWSWAVLNHVRLLGDPGEYVQHIHLGPAVVRIDAPFAFSFEVLSADLQVHFQRLARSTFEGILQTDIPAIDLGTGEVFVRCLPIIGAKEKHACFRFRWGA